MEPDLRRSIRVAGAWLVAFYLVVLIGVASLASFLSYKNHRVLADAIAMAARNSLVIRDLRQAILTVDSASKKIFDSIEFQTFDGLTLFSLTSAPQKNKNDQSVLGVEYSIPITSGSGIAQGRAIGVLTFRYTLVQPVAYSIGIWLISLLIGAPIFYRIKAFIERRHKEILTLRESEALSELACQVSHDIRSPLTAINVVVKQLGDGALSEKKVILEAAAKRINGIANDLLAKHRVSLNQTRPKGLGDKGSSISLTSAPLGPILKSLVREKRLTFSDRTKIELKLDLRGPADAVCLLDEKEFSRALSNLLNNSIEAIEGEGSVTVALRPALKDVAVVVSDTGKGIPEEVLARLGNERVSFGKEQSESGSGLGVLHAKKTVESMNGNFSVQSRVGMGTIVTMTFPRSGEAIEMETPRSLISNIMFRKREACFLEDPQRPLKNPWF